MSKPQIITLSFIVWVKTWYLQQAVHHACLKHIFYDEINCSLEVLVYPCKESVGQ